MSMNERDHFGDDLRPRFPHGTSFASSSAQRIALAVCGPTAAVTYTDIDYGRARGRRYYIHVADEVAPIRTRLFGRHEMENLRHKHGDRVDAAIVEMLLKTELQTPPEPDPQG